MTQQTVAGVDWAKGEWLAVVITNGRHTDTITETKFSDLWERTPDLEQMLIDVPIGLPDDCKSLDNREALDSCARSVTGRSSSVFPVPSRQACRLANEDAEYDDVAAKNEDEIGKGLSNPSYYFAAGIGEIDEFLLSNESSRQVVAESHPEVCFRGLLGRKLQYSKKTAIGVGERLEAMSTHFDAPGEQFEAICMDLNKTSSDAQVDDVIDALGLAVTAWKTLDEVHYLPGNLKLDSKDLPMRMVYWGEVSLI
jgi:predicted RNase H-like nuclease